MKKTIGMLLVCAVIFTSLAIGGTAEETVTPEPKFEIDGKLDVWYLSDGENPAGDYTYYNMNELDPYVNTGSGVGKDMYDDPRITASMWTAYDKDYVYVYVKVWDDSLHPLTDEIKNEGGHSGWVDTIEVWFDPDPNSQSKQDPVTDGWYNQTRSEKQGDTQFRVAGADFKIDDYHDVAKPGYNGAKFGSYIQNRENCYPFYFEDEKANKFGVTKGYGIEARLPRADDEAKAYKLNVAVNDYGEFENERYALATGEAWWMDYAKAISIRYNDEANPFFNQDVSAKLVVKAIDALPKEITQSNKAEVEEIRQQYNALTDEQKEYVNERNYDVLEAAEKALGKDPVSQPSNPSSSSGSSIIEHKRGDINGDGNVNANDALLVLRASVGKATLTANQEKAADLTNDGKVNAADALVILRIAVGKEK